MYCLRSQYVYQHNPPCVYCIPGKEHLIEVNEDLGLYFNDCPAKEELKGKASGHFEQLQGQMSSWRMPGFSASSSDEPSKAAPSEDAK